MIEYLNKQILNKTKKQKKQKTPTEFKEPRGHESYVPQNTVLTKAVCQLRSGLSCKPRKLVCRN